MKKTFLSLWAFSLLLLTTPVIATEQTALSLQEAVAKTLQHNFGIQIAKLEATLGQYDVERSKALYDLTSYFLANHTIDRNEPAVAIFGTENDITNLEAGIAKMFSSGTAASVTWKTEINDTNSTFATINPYYTGSLEFALNQPLLQNFLGRNPRLNTKIVSKQDEILRIQVEDQVETIVANLIEAYWLLVFQKANFDLATDAAGWAAKLLHANRKKRRLGIAEQSDVIAAQANHSIRKQELDEAILARKRASLLLARLANLPLHNNYVGTDPFADTLPAIELSAAVNEALKNRRDLQIVRANLEVSDLLVSYNKNQLWPTLDLTASLRLNGLDDGFSGAQGEFFTEDNVTFFVGGILTYNWDNHDKRATVKKEKIVKEQKLLQLKEIEREIEFQIKEAFLQLTTQADLLAKAAKIVDLQKKKLIEEEKRVTQGRSDTSQLVRHQDDLINAQRAMVGNALNYHLAWTVLLRLQNKLLHTYSS